MRAAVGDKIIVRGRRVAGHAQTRTVLAVRGLNGDPPYLVRWGDGREGLLFPGSDAVVEHLPVVERHS